MLDVFVTQITDVPIIQFTAASYQVDETAGSVTISVQRIGDTTGTATVQFAASNGTATAGSDYGTQGSTTPPSGTLGFGPGQIVATFTIPILNSGSSCEGDETVNLSLNTPSFGTVLGSRNTSTLTILDTSACINFTSPTYTVTENKGPAQISVSRSGPTGILATVQFSTSDLTAVAGIDYTAVVNRTVTFLPGAKTVNVPITILNNTILDGNRSVNLSLSGAVGAQLVPSRSTRRAHDRRRRGGRHRPVRGSADHRDGERGGGAGARHPHRQHGRWGHGRLHDRERHGDGGSRLRRIGNASAPAR